MDAIVTQPATTTTPPTATAAAETVTLMCLACGAEEQVPPGELVTRIGAHVHGDPGETPDTTKDDAPETNDPAAPSIEELLATPAPFRAWCERMRNGYGPDFIVGKACESFWCPLNQFLADELGRDHFSIEVEICPPEVQLLRIDDGETTVEKEGAPFTPPQWAAAFIRQIDLYPSGRAVRVDEALFLLDYIEQSLGAAEGVLP